MPETQAYRPGNIVSHWLEQAEEATGVVVDCLALDQRVRHAWRKRANILLQLGKVCCSEMKKHRWTPYLNHALNHAGTRVSHSAEKVEYLKTLRLQDVPL